MQKFGNHLETLCEKTIKIIMLLISGFLCYQVAGSTFCYPPGYDNEYILEYPDSPFKNLIAAVIILFLSCLLKKAVFRRTGEEQQKGRVRILAVAFTVIAAIILCIWVTFCHMEPYWDQLQVYINADAFRHGDYTNMETIYMSLYTQHYGLIFLEEILLGIWPDYRLFQYINVLFICLIIFLLYLIAEHIFQNPAISLYCLAGITAFIPMHLYVTYVYGDLCSIAFSLLAVWCLMKWDSQGKWPYLAIAAIGSMIALLSRFNTLIPLIAIIITCVILTVRSRNFRPLLFGFVLLVFSLSSVQAVQSCYEQRSGIEINRQIPSALWIAMGMQEEWGGIGTYNGSAESIWSTAGCNKDKATEIAVNIIHQRLQEFRQDPRHAWDFYRYKVLEQWGEPTYSSLMMTGKGIRGSGKLVDYLYFGAVPERIFRIMDYFQFFIYFCTLCYAIDSLRNKDSILTVLLLTAVIGGFLFCLIWEAKSRYMLPYIIFLFPYAAKGIYVLQNASVRLFHRITSGKLRGFPHSS